jgi:hypothetical protein
MPHSTTRVLFAVVIPFALLLAWFGGIGRADRVTAAPARQAAQAGPLLAQPPDWVPFSADVEITVPNTPRVVGRFYRASDGSSRLETGPEDGSRQVISMKNIPAQTFYWFSPAPGYGWTSQPLKLPPEGWRPTQYRANMKDLAKHGERIEGLELYRYVTPSGDVALNAPALNFFSVVRQSVKFGKRERYFNIRLGEPPNDLFSPPAGASVRVLSKPGGIIFTLPGEPSPLEPANAPASPASVPAQNKPD